MRDSELEVLLWQPWEYLQIGARIVEGSASCTWCWGFGIYRTRPPEILVKVRELREQRLGCLCLRGSRQCRVGWGADREAPKRRVISTDLMESFCLFVFHSPSLWSLRSSRFWLHQFQSSSLVFSGCLPSDFLRSFLLVSSLEIGDEPPVDVSSSELYPALEQTTMAILSSIWRCDSCCQDLGPVCLEKRKKKSLFRWMFLQTRKQISPNYTNSENVFFSSFFKKYLFVYCWLHWVFTVAHELSLVAVSVEGYSLGEVHGFSSQWLL